MKNNLLTSKKIAIIGGGPVGLTTARLLQMKGVAVTVYERDTNSQTRISGGTLDLYKETGQKALKKAGLLDIFYKHSRPTGMKAGDMHGKILFTMKPDHGKPEIDRPVLRKMLLDSLSENTVIWDRQVVSIDKNKNTFELQFQNGEKTEANLVIIADGGMSKARKYITEALPEETGTYVIQGEIRNLKADCPIIYELINDHNLAIVEDKKSIFMQNRGDGSLCFYVSFRKNEQWIKDISFDFSNIQSTNQFLYELFADWNPVYQELFKTSSEYIGFPLRTFHAIEIGKPHSNITLVGDAAHVMPPFGGLGVNMGMKDALVLTENLTNGKFSTIQSALDDYEQKMVAYASSIQKETHAADDRIHTQFEHSMKRFKARLNLRILKVVQYIALCFLFLSAGVFWGNWFSFSRSYGVFSIAELTHIAKTIIENLAMPMRFISMACLLFMSLSAWFIPQKNSREFYFNIAAILLILSALLITVIVEVPINDQVITWTPSTAPSDWKEILNSWLLFNKIRTAAALASFGLFTASILKPFENKFSA